MSRPRGNARRRWRPGYESPGWAAYVAADDAWGSELHRVFGRRAGDARYDPDRNQSTLALRALYRRRNRAARRAHIRSKTIIRKAK